MLQELGKVRTRKAETVSEEREIRQMCERRNRMKMWSAVSACNECMDIESIDNEIALSPEIFNE